MKKTIHKTRPGKLLQRVIPPLAVWAVGRLLDMPRVSEQVHAVDRKTRQAEQKVGRRVRAAGRNAVRNRAWTAAGAAAVAIGLSFLAKATRSK